jgi:hypothetical protein
MQITREFLQEEVAHVEAGMREAQAFLVKAQAALDVHRMLLAKLEEPDVSNLPEASDARD